MNPTTTMPPNTARSTEVETLLGDPVKDKGQLQHKNIQKIAVLTRNLQRATAVNTPTVKVGGTCTTIQAYL